MTIEVESAPDQFHDIQAMLDFRLSESKRISAEIKLIGEDGSITVAAGPVVLAAAPAAA